MIAFVKAINPGAASDKKALVQSKWSDAALAQKQHASYIDALRETGARTELLPASAGDGLAVGHAAVVLPEVAILGRTPTEATAIPVGQSLGQHRPLQSIVAPGTLSAADVLRVGRVFYVAESRTTNADGIAQLHDIVRPFGYELKTVELRDCESLRAACSFIPPHHLLHSRRHIDLTHFKNFNVLAADDNELLAVNTLTLGRTTLVSASCPKTEKILRSAGIATRRLDVSEFEKVGWGLACLSLILEPRRAHAPERNSALIAIQADDVPHGNGHSSQAIVSRGVVYVYPVLPFDLSAPRRRRSDIVEQIEHAIRNLSVVLGNAGTSLERVVYVTVHVADSKLVPAIEEPYARMLGRHRPARSVIANPALPPGVLVQIEARATIADE
jgi:dimethylargininase